MEKTKRCSKCKDDFPLSNFYKNKNTKDGLSSQCKTCMSIVKKAYQKTDKGKAVFAKASKKYRSTERGRAMTSKANHKYLSTEKGKIANRKGQANICKALTDAYIRTYIQGNHGYAYTEIPDDLIQVTRALIKASRILKKLRESNTN